MGAKLINMNTGDIAILNKPVFRVGREKGFVDFVVTDRAISRSHCDFVQRGNRWYIVDCNSTNHTYVDGEQIPSNIEVPLRYNSRVHLANVPFLFEEVL